MTALSEIEKLVLEVAKSARGNDVDGNVIPFHEKVEALKVLSPYYLALRKERASEEDTATMADFAKTIQEPEANAPEIRSHRRRQ